MKKILLLFSFFLSQFCFAQNLVPNPSFEDTVHCPSAPAQMYNSTGWSSYSYSPDYFNSCASSTAVSVPNNWGGYQLSSYGNAYCGLATYQSPYAGGNNTREYIGHLLTTPLIVGVQYFVSFEISLSISSPIQVNCATSKIGAMFSTVPYSTSNPAPITNNPPIYSNSIITDSLNWTRIFDSFIADSAYQYIILGNFFNDNNTDTLIMTSDIFCTSYYFLDNVCVSTDSLTCSGEIIKDVAEQMSNSSKDIFPNPVNDILRIKNINRNLDYHLTNFLGQIVKEGKLNEGINFLNLTSISNGIYFLILDYKHYYKIIIKH